MKHYEVPSPPVPVGESTGSISRGVNINISKKRVALVDKHRDGDITKTDTIAEIAATLYSSPDFNDHDKQAGPSSYCEILE